MPRDTSLGAAAELEGVAMGDGYTIGQERADRGATLLDRMGIEVVAAGPERVVATMPVEGNRQPFGLLHGGASCVLAETAGSIGATLHAEPERVAVGVDINATHHRALTDGVVTAEATPVHLGRSIATYQVAITDDTGRRICTARITCHLVPARDG